MENFELPDIGNVKDTKFALKMSKFITWWRKNARNLIKWSENSKKGWIYYRNSLKIFSSSKVKVSVKWLIIIDVDYSTHCRAIFESKVSHHDKFRQLMPRNGVGGRVSTFLNLKLLENHFMSNAVKISPKSTFRVDPLDHFQYYPMY